MRFLRESPIARSWGGYSGGEADRPSFDSAATLDFLFAEALIVGVQ
jgi:hypothetical protein